MNNNINELGNIGVLMGGDSSEREISLKSGRAIVEGLKDVSCKVYALEINSTDEAGICSLIKEHGIGIVFIALHGGAGEDGRVQSMLDKHCITYTGSDAESSRLAMNKVLTQDLLQQNNIPVPDFKIISKGTADSINKIFEYFKGIPVVVKPAREGSSIGINIVKEKNRLGNAIDQAFQYGEDIIIERYISGKEVTVGILGKDPLPLVEIRSQNPFFDFTAKYKKGMTDYIVPAQVPSDIAERIKKAALNAHCLLGCRDFSRVDFMLDEQCNEFLLEINTIPGFTSTSLLPMAAKEAGREFPQLCLEIVRLAVRRQKEIKT